MQSAVWQSRIEKGVANASWYVTFPQQKSTHGSLRTSPRQRDQPLQRPKRQLPAIPREGGAHSKSLLSPGRCKIIPGSCQHISTPRGSQRGWKQACCLTGFTCCPWDGPRAPPRLTRELEWGSALQLVSGCGWNTTLLVFIHRATKITLEEEPEDSGGVPGLGLSFSLSATSPLGVPSPPHVRHSLGDLVPPRPPRQRQEVPLHRRSRLAAASEVQTLQNSPIWDVTPTEKSGRGGKLRRWTPSRPQHKIVCPLALCGATSSGQLCPGWSSGLTGPGQDARLQIMIKGKWREEMSWEKSISLAQGGNGKGLLWARGAGGCNGAMVALLTAPLTLSHPRAEKNTRTGQS